VNGFAVVELPDYYEALNLVGSEIYGLTVIDESTDQFRWLRWLKSSQQLFCDCRNAGHKGFLDNQGPAQ